MIRQAVKAGKAGDWSETWKVASSIRGRGRSYRRATMRCHSEDKDRKRIVQQILQKSTDFLRRINVPVRGAGRSHIVVRVPSLPPLAACRSPRSKGDSSKKGKQPCDWRCTACSGQYNQKDPNRVLVILDSAGPSDASVFRAHAPPQGASENLMCALKLVANQEMGGGQPRGHDLGWFARARQVECDG